MLRNNYFSILSMVWVLLGTQSGFTQNAPTLVKDLVTGVASSNPRDFFNYNNAVYFTADDAAGAPQLFKTDGNTAQLAYALPPDTRLEKAVLANQKWHILLRPTSFGNWSLVQTDLTTTTNIQSLSLYRNNGLAANNNQVVLSYMARPISPLFGGAQVCIIRDVNGTLINVNDAHINSAPYLSSTEAFIEQKEHTWVDPMGKPAGANRKAILAVRKTDTTPSLSTLYTQNAGRTVPPTGFFQTLGAIQDKIYVSIGSTLVSFSVSGVRTDLKTDIGTITHITNAGNVIYFLNERKELWKTDGTTAGTVPLNLNFEVANEWIINLFGGGTSAYIITQVGNIARTYCITPQGTLSRVQFGHDVTYSQPFVSKGIQYIYAQQQLANQPCTIPYLVRYEQTEAQSKSFELRDKNSAACQSNLPNPILSMITENDVFYYGLNTNALGTELWKLDLKNSCASKGATPWDLWISKVSLGALQNASSPFKDIKTAGYSDYTNLSTDLEKGQSYPLNVTPSLGWIGNLPHAYCRAWIDFNKNDLFEPNELVLEKAGQNPLNQTITVPTNALAGITRMRVSVKWDGYPTACEAFAKGEV